MLQIIYENSISLFKKSSKINLVSCSGYFLVKNQILKNNKIISHEPLIHYKNSREYYTIILINLNTGFLHWWISNIHFQQNFRENWVNYYMNINQFKKQMKMDLNHFVFYFYKQCEFIEKEKEINSFQFRQLFKLMTWVKHYNLQLVENKYFSVYI
jgi:hypothetical protein